MDQTTILQRHHDCPNPTTNTEWCRRYFSRPLLKSLEENLHLSRKKGWCRNPHLRALWTSKWPQTMQHLEIQFLHLRANLGMHVIFHGPGSHLEFGVLFDSNSCFFFAFGPLYTKRETQSDTRDTLIETTVTETLCSQGFRLVFKNGTHMCCIFCLFPSHLGNETTSMPCPKRCKILERYRKLRENYVKRIHLSQRALFETWLPNLPTAEPLIWCIPDMWTQTLCCTSKHSNRWHSAICYCEKLSDCNINFSLTG